MIPQSLRKYLKSLKHNLKWTFRRLARHYSLCRMLFARNNGKLTVHVLHIGKTGGTAIKEALRADLASSRCHVELHGHDVILKDIPKGDKVVFFVRDPISRYISGFYSRQRQGEPRHLSPWSSSEETAFSMFKTPNELALALSAPDDEQKDRAIDAMNSIEHVRDSYWKWFGSKDHFLSRKADILFIGYQNNLSQDFDHLKYILSVDESVQLPDDDMRAHRNPTGLDKRLDDEARNNLMTWFASDYEFISLCNTISRQITSPNLTQPDSQ